jgi:ABC-type multidrug transport system fused ATPase/permease subunit
MDRIFVVGDGEILESGNHKELLRNENGIYAKLWKIQQNGFIE